MRATKAVKVSIVSAAMIAVAAVGLWTTSPLANGAVVPGDAAVVDSTAPATVQPAEPVPTLTDLPSRQIPPKTQANGTCNYCAYTSLSSSPK